MPGNISTKEVAWATMAAVAFGSVTASYTTALTNTNPLQIIDVFNGTDAAVYLSFDATNNHLYIPVSGVRQVNLGCLQMHDSSNVSVKHAGAAPTSGALYISGAY